MEIVMMRRRKTIPKMDRFIPCFPLWICCDTRNCCLFAPDSLAFWSFLVEVIAVVSFNLVLSGGIFAAESGFKWPGIICFSCLISGQVSFAVATLPVFAIQK